MARPPPPDEASPARLIATMVGIVGILLLGSLAWSAVGALFAALGQAATSLSPRPASTPAPRPVVAAPATPTSASLILGSTAVVLAPTAPPSLVALTPTAPPSAEAATASLVALTPTAPSAEAATATPAASGRAPWILLPQPAPGTRVPPGVVVVEARGRGDAPITAIRLE